MMLKAVFLCCILDDDSHTKGCSLGLMYAAKRVTRARDLAAQAKPSSEMASGRTREPWVCTNYINARLHPSRGNSLGDFSV